MLRLQLQPAPSAGTMDRHIFHHGSDLSLAARFRVCKQQLPGPPDPPWPWTSVRFLSLLQILPAHRHHDQSSERRYNLLHVAQRQVKNKEEGVDGWIKPLQSSFGFLCGQQRQTLWHLVR